MLQIHGNGESIASMGHQIQYFSNRYRVIAADSRGHGKSEMGSGRLTYEQMADDLNALLEKRGLKSVYVLGWSDGGILGLPHSSSSSARRRQEMLQQPRAPTRPTAILGS